MCRILNNKEFDFLTCRSSQIEEKKSQKQSSDPVSSDTDNNASLVTDENKKLVAVQGQEDPHNKSFSKTMNTA